MVSRWNVSLARNEPTLPHNCTLSSTKNIFVLPSPSVITLLTKVFAVMVRAKAAGYHVEELPITFVDRVYGDSKLGGEEIVQYLKSLAWLWWSV